jgi:hypothetical protein
MFAKRGAAMKVTYALTVSSRRTRCGASAKTLQNEGDRVGRVDQSEAKQPVGMYRPYYALLVGPSRNLLSVICATFGTLLLCDPSKENLLIRRFKR